MTFYQTKVLLRSHDQMGHQGIDKVQQRKLHRFDREEGLREVDQCMLVKMTQEK